MRIGWVEGLDEREVTERVRVLYVCGGSAWGGPEVVEGVHEASLPYQRRARLFCPNGNYTVHNWRSLLVSQQEKKIEA